MDRMGHAAKLPLDPIMHSTRSTAISMVHLCWSREFCSSLVCGAALIVGLSLSLGIFTAPAWGAPPTSQRAAIGAKIEAFELTDCLGREWESKELLGSKGTVIAFLGTQCPLAKLYTQRLAEMAKELEARDIRFVAIDSNVQDSLAEMSAHAKRFGLTIPFLKDPNQEVADRLGATRTPEVCLLDGDGVLRYRGRIDDQYGIGYTKDAPTQSELKDAITALLRGDEVKVSSVPAPGCLIGRNKSRSDASDPNPTITYAEHIAPILNRHCVSCHRNGDIGPMDLSQYDDAAAWADMIVEVTQDRRMPPWHASPEHGHFSNDRRLTEQEIDLLEQWASSGTPPGERTKTPPAPQFQEGWLLAKTPDIVVSMADKPFSIPARGDVQYQYFVRDMNNEKELWFQGMEVVPGNREVVHHILVFAREKGSRRQELGGERSFLVGYVPGTRATMMEPGYAKRIPPNTQLIFQVHYTPNGSPQQDLSKVGFVLADPATITHEVMTTSAVNVRLEIPPREANYQSNAMLPERLPDCELLSMSPHMHVRGKSYRYTLVLPDKKREVLLDIPRYDFNWQTEYRLAEKRSIPKGSKIYCEAVFDNSAENLNNPNPDVWVRWGDQTYEEMMIGCFHYAVKR